MERDADAFHRFTAALNLPKGTAEEKTARTAAIQNALILCIESPLHTMELSLDAAKMIERMPGKTNMNAVSDLGVAVMMLESTVRSAWLNVLINLGYLKDSDRASLYRYRGEQLLNDTLACTGAVYEQADCFVLSDAGTVLYRCDAPGSFSSSLWVCRCPWFSSVT